MKEKSKRRIKNISNILLLIFIGVILFTPMGTDIKIWVNKIIAGTPNLEKPKNQEIVDFSSWILMDETSKKVEFSKFKGKVILVNFWATWCAPCIAEKPSLQELYNDYKDRIVFVFLTTDSEDVVKTYKDKHAYSFPVYYSLSEAPSALQSNSIPASFLIDKSGKVVVKMFRAANWNDKKFRDILDELIQEDFSNSDS